MPHTYTFTPTSGTFRFEKFAEYSEARVDFEAKHPPFEFLPSAYLPGPENDPVPLLSYGFAIRSEDAVAFAEKHGLVGKIDPNLAPWCHLSATCSYICREARLYGARLAMPRSSEYDWVIELFDNYDMDERLYTDKQMKKRVAHALGLLGEYGQEPLWWWSSDGISGPQCGVHWPTSWCYPELVAPRYRARVPQSVWDEWRAWVIEEQAKAEKAEELERQAIRKYLKEREAHQRRREARRREKIERKREARRTEKAMVEASTSTVSRNGTL
ncbi:hypothetical protein C8Q80DRAFT_1199008 [Daedaleopsis nitida]|nr:hypothetical protein C8Q80DRAFT_1199008 [Daedaleopsis nitida]